MSRRRVNRASAVKQRRQQAETGRYSSGHNILDTDALAEHGIKEYRIREENWWRIIPPADPEAKIEAELFTHSYIGPDNDSFICPNAHFKKPCPICQEFTRLNGKGLEWEEIRHLKNTPPRFGYLLVDMENEKTIEEGVQACIAPKTVMEGIVSICVDRRSGEAVDPSYPDEPFDVFFAKKGQGKTGTRYEGFKLETPKDFDVTPDEWLDVVPEDFMDLVHKPDFDEMKASMLGGAAAEEEDEEEKEEEQPRRRSSRRSSREDLNVEDDDDLKFDKDEGPKEEEKEEPRRRRSSHQEEEKEEETPRRSRRDDDEEEDDEQEESSMKKRLEKKMRERKEREREE